VQRFEASLLDAVANETTFWAGVLPDTALISYTIEPFLPTLATHRDSSIESAFPPAAALSLQPILLNIVWLFQDQDEEVLNAAKASVQRLAEVAKEMGVGEGVASYPNYALADTPLEEMYGENVPRLRALKRLVDPDGVMNLAGGFKF